MISTEQPDLNIRSDDGRIAIIAGGGALPVAVARTLKARGVDPFVAVLAGEAIVADFSDVDHIVVTLEEFGPLLARFGSEGVTRVVLAGSVARRPKLLALKWNWTLLRIISRTVAGLVKGDDGLLRTVIGAIEKQGMQVVGAHEIVPDLLAPSGTLTKAKPGSADQRDIEAASEAAIAIGRLDIGQAAIAIGGRVVALEGIEGTEALLERTGAMRGHGRLAGKTRGVLVKHCKPQQERRADLPAIGPDTMDQAHNAGLAGVAVEAGCCFILDFDKAIARADELGLYVVGLEPQNPEAA
jgi:DUF1009 family protein